MALQTLRAMAGGGIYDQVGGGFARYSVDARWTVPHFEKMLYDNALLARAYLHGWQVSGDGAAAPDVPRRRSTGRCARCAAPRAASTARSTPTPRASRAGSTCGRVDELREALGRRRRRGDRLARRQRAGQLRGRRTSSSRARARAAAPSSASGSARGCSRSARERVRPGLDDKRLTALERADDRRARRRRRGARARARLPRRGARGGARSCSTRCATRDGRLLRTYNDGHGASSTPTSRTTRSCSRRCSSLYEATCEERWFAEARGARRHDRSRASPTPSAAASSRPPPTTRR